MKLASFLYRSTEAWGLVQADRVSILSAVVGGAWPTLRDAIAADALTEAINSAANAPLAGIGEISWRPVIPNPGKILCVGLNYETHRSETGRAPTARPAIFVRFPDSQLGHLEAMECPVESGMFDYEGEFAVVIGKAGRRIPARAALEHVAGYACYNDGSVRDWQWHSTQFTPGKNFPRTGSFGPWLITPEEFGPIAAQRIQTRLNGSVMQDAKLSDMIFPVSELIEYISTFTPLAAGDVICTGTPGGVGAKRNPPVFMKAGDRVEVEIDGIGALVNSVAAPHG